MSLIDQLISNNYLKTPLIIEAFRKIKRIDFLPEEIKSLYESDEALPIGEGQTISQPAVVAFMLELLQPKPGDKILDIGSGSGWTSALLAYITSKKNKKGKVFAIEVIEILKEFGEKNVLKYNFIKKGIVKFICGDGTKGLEKEAPFDKILVSAAAQKVPEKLKEQLKIGGRIVIPIKDQKEDFFYSQSIYLLEKKSQNNFKIKKYPGFVFVPLVHPVK
jgi:protein-L-isoaspartate(D-aspartate) O-methyltransferase